MLRKGFAYLLSQIGFACVDIFFITLTYFSLYLYRVTQEFNLNFMWAQVLDYDFWAGLTYFSGYVKFYIVVTVVCIFLLRRYELYTVGVKESLPDEFWKVTKAVIYSVLAIAALSFMFKIQLFSRFVFICFSIATVFALWLWRLLKRWFLLQLLKKGYLKKNLLIVGAGEMGQLVAEELTGRPGLGYEVIGFGDDDTTKLHKKFKNVQVICTNANLADAVIKYNVDEILITIPSQRQLIQDIITQCRRLDVEIRIIPEMFNLMTTAVEVGKFGPVPYMGIVKTPMRGAQLAFKRLFDVAVSLLGIIAISPVLIGTAIAVKLDSPGPVLFKQKRVGKNGQLFDFYKFRSMVPNAEDLLKELAAANEVDGPVFKIKEDPRITKVGKFIRKYSIDELPQLINVLKGDMSLVGPRPPLPKEVDKYGDFEWRRLEVIPGITGLWQVSGRSNLSFNKWMELDVYYIENWSFWLDLKIMLQTVPVVLTGKGAY